MSASTARFSTALALSAATPQQRRIYAALASMGIDDVLLAELAATFHDNPRRALALAKDLGWHAELARPASHRGYADASGNYSPELYEAAQRQARARADAKRTAKVTRKQARLRAAGKIR
jgi:hypothetical protein